MRRNDRDGHGGRRRIPRADTAVVGNVYAIALKKATLGARALRKLERAGRQAKYRGNKAQAQVRVAYRAAVLIDVLRTHIRANGEL